MVDAANISGPVPHPATVHARPSGHVPGRSQLMMTALPDLLQQAAAIAGQGPPIDGVKVAQIRTAISRSDYAVDSRAIADAMARQVHR